MTSTIAYVNGSYLPLSDAAVHVEDRGYQFADGVYEVIAIINGRLVDGPAHIGRLEKSLAGLDIEPPCSMTVLGIIMSEVIRRNRLKNGSLYLQITRGVATRNHAFPVAETRASLVITANRKALPGGSVQQAGIDVITIPESRWARPDIKSVSLLPNVLAKQEAVRKGAFEAWFVDSDDLVTEGSSTNAWIVNEDGKIITPPLNGNILAGITRGRVIALAEGNRLEVIERAFSIDEAFASGEAFLSSTTACVLPVVRIDNQPVGDGKPGPVTRHLMALYASFLEEVATGDA